MQHLIIFAIFHSLEGSNSVQITLKGKGNYTMCTVVYMRQNHWGHLRNLPITVLFWQYLNSLQFLPALGLSACFYGVFFKNNSSRVSIIYPGLHHYHQPENRYLILQTLTPIPSLEQKCSIKIMFSSHLDVFFSLINHQIFYLDVSLVSPIQCD